MKKFTAEIIFSGKFNFLSASAANKKHQLDYFYISSKCLFQKKVKSSQEPELIALTQIDFVDLTEEKCDNGGDSTDVTHISETLMVVDSDDTLCYKSDSCS